MHMISYLKGNRSRRAAIVFSVAGLLIPEAAPAQDVEAGLELAEKWCNSCHSIGTDAPRQEDAGPIWVEIATKPPDELRAALDTPHDFMPDFPGLDDADKDNLVSYIRSLE